MWKPPYQGEAALFGPGHECNSPVECSNFERLVSGYRTNHTALSGKPHYSFEVISAIPQSSLAILTAIYRDTALYGNTALSGEAAIFILGHECNSSFESSILNALYRDTALITPPYRGKPPYSFQVMSAIPQSSLAILTAIYRYTALLETAFLRDPYFTTKRATQSGAPHVFLPPYVSLLPRRRVTA